jgi:hypothetical protein
LVSHGDLETDPAKSERSDFDLAEFNDAGETLQREPSARMFAALNAVGERPF